MLHRGRKQHHTASVDSIDYELSSSDDEMNARQSAAKMAEKDIDDEKNEQLEITIARDRRNLDADKSDCSDAKTSDITRVGHGKDLSGILHERATTSVSASQKLETRSDLSQAISGAPNKNPETPKNHFGKWAKTILILLCVISQFLIKLMILEKIRAECLRGTDNDAENVY